MSGSLLHTRFSRTLLKRFTDTAKEYEFFKKDDIVRVNVSFNVYSLLSAALLLEYARYGNVPIKVILSADSAEVSDLCARIFKTECNVSGISDTANITAAFECFDDIIEDILAGVLFNGRSAAILPKERGIVRPLYKIRRHDIEEWKNSALPDSILIPPLTPERQCVSEIIRRLNAKNPQVCQNIFRSVCTVRLDHIISYIDFNGDKKILYEYSEK